MNRAFGLAVVLTLALASPARAQSWEVSGLFGFTPSTGIDKVARGVDELNIKGGTAWGLQVSRALSAHWAAEGLWMQQLSGVEIVAPTGKATLFDLTASQIHGNVVYRFGSAGSRLQPFAFAGLGATFFRADDVPSETKLSLGLGGGISYFAWNNVGVRGHFRYKPTMLNDDSDNDSCDPFGFCQNTLQQVEVAVGAVVRF